MITWKTKLFGDNRINFYSWIFTGFTIAGLSLSAIWVAAWAMEKVPSAAGPDQQVVALHGIAALLAALWVLSLGHFLLALQNYLARVAKAIEVQDELKHQDKSR